MPEQDASILKEEHDHAGYSKRVRIVADDVGIGGGTQYATNVAYADGNSGTLALVVRDDSLSTLTEADGDYSTLRVSSTGALHVTGGGGGTEYTEDVATANPIVGSAIMVERDDALTTVTPVEGDNIGLRGTAEGALWTQDFNSDAILSDTTAIKTSLETAGGQVVNLGANNDVTVTSGAITATLSATDNAVLGTIDAVLDTINAKLVTGTVIGDVNLGATDNAVLDAIAASVAGTLTVGSHAVTNAGTFATQATLQANSGVDIGKLTANQSVNVAQMNGVTTTMGNGASGTGVQRVTVASDSTGQIKLAAGTAAIGKLTANSGVDIGDVTLNNLTSTPVFIQHSITALGHGVKTVTSAGTDLALASSTACKRVVIQAQTDNTGLIAVGATGVDATEATGTGIILYAGDTITIETDNLADIFIDSTVNGEGVRFTYYT